MNNRALSQTTKSLVLPLNQFILLSVLVMIFKLNFKLTTIMQMLHHISITAYLLLEIKCREIWFFTF